MLLVLLWFMYTSIEKMQDDNHELFTDMFHATRAGDCKRLSSLRARGADINTLDMNGYTPLSTAAYMGHTNVVQLLKSWGADFERPNNQGWTALNGAAANGHLEIVKLLKSWGADFEKPDKNGWTPLNSAAFNGHLDVVELLKSWGACFETAEYNDWTAPHWSLKSLHRVSNSFNDTTQLRNATDNGHNDPVALLTSSLHFRRMIHCG